MSAEKQGAPGAQPHRCGLALLGRPTPPGPPTLTLTGRASPPLQDCSRRSAGASPSAAWATRRLPEACEQGIRERDAVLRFHRPAHRLLVVSAPAARGAPCGGGVR